MTLLDYYKSGLSKSVAAVHSYYFSPNLVPEDFPYYVETFNCVVYADGTQEYFFHPYEYGHTLDPVPMKSEWMQVAVCCDLEDLDEELQFDEV